MACFCVILDGLCFRNYILGVTHLLLHIFFFHDMWAICSCHVVTHEPLPYEYLLIYPKRLLCICVGADVNYVSNVLFELDEASWRAIVPQSMQNLEREALKHSVAFEEVIG